MKGRGKIYSRRLMHEAMRQIKLPGIIGTLLFAGIAFFSTIVKLFEARESGEVVFYYSFMDLNSYIMLVMYIFAPLMVMLLFGFMNRRKASDFYHSLSYSRLCIYISFLTAVILWCVIIIASGSLVTVVITAVERCLQIDFKTALFTVVSAVAGCILTMGITVLAMSLTGTYLTNVFTAVLILLVPRGMVLVCNELFSAATPFVVLTGSGLIGNENNIPFAIIAGVLGYYGTGGFEMFESIVPSIYSAVLGLIYIGIGAFCFVRRKSENATQASINRVLQSILRMLPALVISLVAVSRLFNAHSSGKGLSETDRFIVIMSYVAATVAYFLYEVITTRQIKKIYRTIPGLFIVFAVNFVIYFSLRFTYDYHISQTPDAGELAYVVVHGPEDNIFWNDTDDVKLYTEAARGVAGDCLKDTISLWLYDRAGAKGFYAQLYSRNMVIEYHYADGRSITRKVIVSDTRYTQLQRALTNESSFADNFGRSVFAGLDIRSYVGSLDFDSEAGRAVFDTFVAELKTKGVSKLFESIDDRSSSDSLFQIGLLSKNGARYSTAYVGVDMPFTLTAYINALNRQYGGNECERFLNLLGDIKEHAESEDDGTYLSGWIDFYLYTVLPDGSLEKNNVHVYSYDDESYTQLASDACAEYISKLGRMLNVRTVSTADIRPGAMLLYVSYSEERQVPSVNYDGTEYSVSYLSTIAQSDTECGWYMVDAGVAELIKNISKEETVGTEK